MQLQCLHFLIMWYLEVVRMHQLLLPLIIVLESLRQNSLTRFLKKILEVLNVTLGQQILEEDIGGVKRHSGAINALALNPDGKSFASEGEDGPVRLHQFDPSTSRSRTTKSSN